MLSISIPNPCHENWDAMVPRDQGVFCDVCARTVMDFTKMSDEEVQNYFLQHRGQKTCGRFRDDQLAEPKTLDELLSRPIPFWKKFLAIVVGLFGMFLTGCTDKNKTSTKDTSQNSSLVSKTKYTTTTGVPLIELIPDTTVKGNTCSVISEDIITEGMIEIPLISYADSAMQMVEDPIEKPDTVFFNGEIKIDTIKNRNAVISNTDSLKRVIKPNECDTLPLRAIEP